MKINRDRLVLSVEGDLCAGSEALAKELAKELRIPCLCGEILETAHKLSGISKKLLRRYEERPVRSAYDLTASGEHEMRLPPAGDFLAAQIAACRELADEGPCVLVAHHANAALSDRQDHVSIFVHAGRTRRLTEYARQRGLSPAAAEPRFKQDDRLRSRYFRSVFPNWGRASSYDLTVNAGTAAPEVLAGHILHYLETVTREQLVHPTQARKRSA
ncbi:MAG: cytidylate kinase-like family protein [Oscillospiraceae bacterium]|nr:cytidylate kinase-like family protein [Oscillospiraceae bacterium]